MDFSIKLHNGQVLRGMIKSPGEKTKAVVVLVHGLGEHIHRYDYWADLFMGEGIAFTGVDLPGHGRSDGRRGNVKSYAILDEMIDILLNSSRRTFPGVPLYIYGHSLGGGIVLEYLLKKKPRVKGAIVTSPWLRLSFTPPKIKVVMASVVKNLIPGLIQSSGLNTKSLSQDPEMIEKYEKDPLVHGKISVGLFYEAMTSGEYSLKHASDLNVPTLLMHGSDDLLTSPESSIEFAGNTKMVELKIWNGGYHELHNEPFKDEVFNYIMNWIKMNQV